jgi:anti-sigma B factor antagonist
MSIQQVFAPASIHCDEEPLVSLELTVHGTVTVITVSGELDMSTASLFTDMVEAIAMRSARVVVDMARVTFLCATGLRGLIQARNQISARGGRLVLRAPSRPTRRMLMITRTDCLFPLAGDLFPLAGDATS